MIDQGDFTILQSLQPTKLVIVPGKDSVQAVKGSVAHLVLAVVWFAKAKQANRNFVPEVCIFPFVVMSVANARYVKIDFGWERLQIGAVKSMAKGYWTPTSCDSHVNLTQPDMLP
jgi:hypothetical protein